MKQAFVGLSIGILLALGGYFGYQYLYPAQPIEQIEKYHVHADFAVYLDGKKYNFAQEKYMVSIDVCELENQTKRTHLHDMNDNVAHVHAPDQTWGIFFSNIGFTLTYDLKKDYPVLETDEGKVYENGRMFVNGKEIPKQTSFNGYEIKDLDQVAFFFGNTNEQIIGDGLAQVTKQSCIYSGKCPIPEGVKLPEEHCGSEE